MTYINCQLATVSCQQFSQVTAARKCKCNISPNSKDALPPLLSMKNNNIYEKWPSCFVGVFKKKEPAPCM